MSSRLGWHAILALLLIFCGCSTIDKRVFYKAESTALETSKEVRQISSCEMGGPLFTIPLAPQRDSLKQSFKFENDDFQIFWSFHPIKEFESYWWGPLWVPIVPIFLFKTNAGNGPQAVIKIWMDKEWKNKYVLKDKSTWKPHADEIARTVFPKISKVSAIYSDENNKERTELGFPYQEHPGDDSKLKSEYGFNLPTVLPSNLKISFYIEDQKFDFALVKNHGWLFDFYLLGCIQ